MAKDKNGVEIKIGDRAVVVNNGKYTGTLVWVRKISPDPIGNNRTVAVDDGKQEDVNPAESTSWTWAGWVNSAKHLVVVNSNGGDGNGKA